MHGVVRVWLFGGYRVSLVAGTIKEREWRLRKATRPMNLLVFIPRRQRDLLRVAVHARVTIDATEASNGETRGMAASDG